MTQYVRKLDAASQKNQPFFFHLSLCSRSTAAPESRLTKLYFTTSIMTVAGCTAKAILVILAGGSTLVRELVARCPKTVPDSLDRSFIATCRCLCLCAASSLGISRRALNLTCELTRTPRNPSANRALRSHSNPTT